MSNSPLVSYTQISPNRTSPRNKPVDRITPHCVVGQCSVETLGAIFAPASKEASSNYGIGYDGRVGMYCEEKDRSWCTSSSANDNRAITIECASDATAPYAFRDAVYESLINLCVDICKRYGKKKLLWLGNKDKTLVYTPAADEMILTAHRWFANKGCPGDWLYQREADLAAKVTVKLTDGVETVKGYTTITGTAKATVGQMRAYIQAKNSNVPNSVLDMIPLYLSEGGAEGIRGDVAFAQSCLETGNFAFAGSAVTLDQNNFCGMGVTANGMKGNSFDSPQLGIRAQIQHLKAYANTDPLKNPCIDPRFKYVERGSAAYVEWLGQKENPNGKGWASGAGYGEKILTILKAILATKEPEKEKTEMRYNKIADMPDYAKATITKMVKKGFIGGAGKAKDENGLPADLDLSIDMIRVFVTNDRAGLYGE